MDQLVDEKQRQRAAALKAANGGRVDPLATTPVLGPHDGVIHATSQRAAAPAIVFDSRCAARGGRHCVGRVAAVVVRLVFVLCR